jgi:hypothetical protein
MDYEIKQILTDPDWYDKYHNYVILQGRIACSKELLAYNRWVHTSCGLPWNQPVRTFAVFNCIRDGQWKEVGNDHKKYAP